MKSFLELHILQNFSPSNLNRDDTGAPKDAIFGGTRRARISSQCIKKATRSFFSEKKDTGFFKEDELGVRTKRIFQAVTDYINDDKDKTETIQKIKALLQYVKINEKESDKTQYLLYLGKKEIRQIAEILNLHWDKIKVEEPKKNKEEKSTKPGKKDTAAKAPKEIKKQLEAIFNGGKAVDIALFGRMLADMPEKNQNAACQVAHAISTHPVEREFDFYTAIDDLKPDDNAGSDMIGTVEFNSACFYRYAVIDIEKYRQNLQDDDELMLKGVQAFIEGFSIAEPSGMQNSFAAHNPPEFLIACIRKEGAPRNIANSFEKGIRVKKDQSLTEESAKQFIQKFKKLNNAYGYNGETIVLNLTDADTSEIGNNVNTLKELIEKSIKSIGDSL